MDQGLQILYKEFSCGWITRSAWRHHQSLRWKLRLPLDTRNQRSIERVLRITSSPCTILKWNFWARCRNGKIGTYCHILIDIVKTLSSQEICSIWWRRWWVRSWKTGRGSWRTCGRRDSAGITCWRVRLLWSCQEGQILIQPYHPWG